MNSSDFYHVLGVSRSATQDEIRKAFRTLAMRYHPDKNPDNRVQAEQKFKEIGQAYQVIGDPSSRQLYDRAGLNHLYGHINPRWGFQGGGCGRGRCGGFRRWTIRD